MYIAHQIVAVISLPIVIDISVFAIYSISSLILLGIALANVIFSFTMQATVFKV